MIHCNKNIGEEGYYSTKHHIIRLHSHVHLFANILVQAKVIFYVLDFDVWYFLPVIKKKIIELGQCM